MTIGKVSALAAGMVGAVALGVAIGPSITPHADRSRIESPPAIESPQPAAAPDPQATATPGPRVLRKAPRPGETSPTARVEQRTASPKVVATAPALGIQLKPVLNRGANMTVAAEGFRDAEQFATVAHAARNTGVPFMLLKHRVLDEKQSLTAAIRASNPKLDAEKEAGRARTQAKADVAAVSSRSAN